MGRILFGLLVLVPMAASAQSQPSVLLMPTATLGAIRQYLGTRPHDEVAGLIAAMEICASAQVPDKDGKLRTDGCRPVTEALASQAQDRARANAAR